MDSPAYLTLGHAARSLLLEIARQFVRNNNGRLLASGAYLAKRGWKSNDVITRAIRELTSAGLIHQTVQGHRPNKASWYAVTWRDLDRDPRYDYGAVETFRRGAYQHRSSNKNATLAPPNGVAKVRIAPAHGVGDIIPAPPHGATKPLATQRSTPPDGDHLEKPSAVTRDDTRKRRQPTQCFQPAKVAY